MIAMQIALGFVYLIGIVVSFFKVYATLVRKTNDGDPENLDALTAMAASVFWPVWIWFYAIYRLYK